MMRYIYIALCLWPYLLVAQAQDSLTLSQEVDSLLQDSEKLVKEQKFDSALQIIQLAKRKAEEAFGKLSLAYANSTHHEGLIYLQLRRLPEAETVCTEAMEIIRDVLGNDHINYPKSITSLATVYLYKGDFAKAEILYIEAKEAQDRIQGSNNLDYASILTNLGLVYLSTAQYSKSELVFNEARDIIRFVMGVENNTYAHITSALALLYYSIGNYLLAEDLFLESLKINENTIGKKHYQYASNLVNLAIVYMAKKDYTKAEPLYIEAKEIIANTFGKSHIHYASVLNNLATIYFRLENYNSAELLFIESKDIREKALGKTHQDYASSLLGLANLYIMQGEYSKAEPLYIESNEIRLATLGANHPDYAASLTNLAILYRMMKRYGEAELLFAEALETRKRVLGREHLDYYNSVHNFAMLYQQAIEPIKAQPIWIEVMGLIHHHLDAASIYSGEREMLVFMGRFYSDVDRFYSFSHAFPAPELHKICYDNSLFFKGFILENNKKISHLAQTSDSLTQNLLNRWQSNRRLLANEYTKPITDRSNVDEIRAETETLEKLLIRQSSAFQDTRIKPRWNDIRDQLREDEAAIEFIRFNYQVTHSTDSVLYAALVLRSFDDAPHLVSLFEEKQLLQLLDASYLSPEVMLKDMYVNRPELYMLFWLPLKSYLQNTRTVYYSPTGLLHFINPIALLDDSGNGISKDIQWVRLGSTKALLTEYLADASFIDSLRYFYSNSSLIFGGIEYQMDSATYTLIHEQVSEFAHPDYPYQYNSPWAENIEPNDDSRTLRLEEWLPLQYSEAEVDMISELLKYANFDIEVHKGLFASEERLKVNCGSGISPRVLHLATHGFSFPKQKVETRNPSGIAELPPYKLMDDPMFRSGLVLAGANHYWKTKNALDGYEDGILVAFEASDLDLSHTELVVLSACQTGLGEVVGSEGVYGLQRAFRIAGAKFLIVSLWQVPDKQTHELMQLFYSNWVVEKQSLRDAFANAQKSMQEKYTNPYLWAGFVLIE